MREYPAVFDFREKACPDATARLPGAPAASQPPCSIMNRFLARVACLSALAAVSGRTPPGPLDCASLPVPSRSWGAHRTPGRSRPGCDPVSVPNDRGVSLRRLVTALMVLVLAGSVLTTRADSRLPQSGPAQGEWRFRVYLDDKEIGSHDFFLEQQGALRVLRSAADFEYRLLFVKLYEYQHVNRETWQGDCLSSIESSTDANGKPYAVLGQRADGAFIVESDEGEALLPSCVMSFAYWNPEFLKQTHLLNSQNGEYLEVDVSAPVTEELRVRGELHRAIRYRLTAGDLELELWYSEDQKWLGLSSETEGGRTLRYELM